MTTHDIQITNIGFPPPEKTSYELSFYTNDFTNLYLVDLLCRQLEDKRASFEPRIEFVADGRRNAKVYSFEELKKRIEEVYKDFVDKECNNALSGDPDDGFVCTNSTSEKPACPMSNNQYKCENCPNYLREDFQLDDAVSVKHACKIGCF